MAKDLLPTQPGRSLPPPEMPIIRGTPEPHAEHSYISLAAFRPFELYTCLVRAWGSTGLPGGGLACWVVGLWPFRVAQS